jgi:3-keto steroid reductase
MRALKQEHKLKGRRPGAVDVTEEKLVEFKELGAECWRRMEELRARWEERVDAVEKGQS